MLKEAILYKRTENNSSRCFLCGDRCFIAEGGTGFCGVRKNISGIPRTLVYGEAAAANIDPVAKKPVCATPIRETHPQY